MSEAGGTSRGTAAAAAGRGTCRLIVASIECYREANVEPLRNKLGHLIGWIKRGMVRMIEERVIDSIQGEACALHMSLS